MIPKKWPVSSLQSQPSVEGGAAALSCSLASGFPCTPSPSPSLSLRVVGGVGTTPDSCWLGFMGYIVLNVACLGGAGKLG